MKNTLKKLIPYAVAGLSAIGLANNANAQNKIENDSIDYGYDKVVKFVQEGDTAALFQNGCFINFVNENLDKKNIADRPTWVTATYDGSDVLLKGQNQFEWSFPKTNDIELYQILTTACPDVDPLAFKNLVFEGAGKNEIIDQKQQTVDSLEKKLADQRNFFGKMVFGVGGVAGVNNVMTQDGSSAYQPHVAGVINVKAPLWTIKEQDLSRHVILGSVEAVYGSPKVLSDEKQVSSEYTQWTQIAPNLYATQLVEEFERTAVQNLAAVGLAYNFAVPVKDRVFQENKWVEAKDFLSFTLGAGVNVSGYGTNSTTKREDFMYSEANPNSVLLGRGQASDAHTLDAQQNLGADGLYLRVGMSATDNVGFEFGANHLFFGESSPTYQMTVTYTPNTFKKIQK